MNDRGDCRTAPATPGLLTITLAITKTRIHTKTILASSNTSRNTAPTCVSLKVFCTMSYPDVQMLFFPWIPLGDSSCLGSVP